MSSSIAWFFLSSGESGRLICTGKAQLYHHALRRSGAAFSVVKLLDTLIDSVTADYRTAR